MKVTFLGWWTGVFSMDNIFIFLLYALGVAVVFTILGIIAESLGG